MKRDIYTKGEQMVLAKSLSDDKAKDVLLTLIWKSPTLLVHRVLVERGIINPEKWAKGRSK